MTRTDLHFDSLNYGQALTRTTFPFTDLLCHFSAVIIFITEMSNVTHEINRINRQLNLPSKLYFESVHITSTFNFILLIEIVVFSS